MQKTGIIILLGMFLFIDNGLQAQVKKDSLWSVWTNARNRDTVRLAALKNYIWKNYLFTKQDSAYKLVQEQVRFAKKVKNKKWEADAYNTEGITFFFQSKYNLALNSYLKSLKLYTELDDKPGMSKCYGNMGGIYQYQGDYPMALECQFKSLKIENQMGSAGAFGPIYSNIGAIYDLQGEYDKALVYFQKSLKLREKEDSVSYANALDDIAITYEHKGDMKTGMPYQLKSFHIRKRIRDETGLATSYINLGGAYRRLGQLDTALAYFNNGLKIAQRIHNRNLEALALYDIGVFNARLKDFDKAIDYCSRSLELYAESAMLPREQMACNCLYVSYKAKGNLAKALEFHERETSIKDSLMNDAKKKMIIQKEFQLKYDQKTSDDSLRNEAKRKLQDAETTAKLKQEATVRYALFVGLALVLVFSLFLVNRFRIIRRQKTVIEKQKIIVEEKQKEVIDSIRYAKRIQDALLKNEVNDTHRIPEHFILFKPKDIVSGDFYWLMQKNEFLYMAAADCTGHGVPGGFLTMLGTSFLNEITAESLLKPAEVLDRLRNKFIRELSQKGTAGEAKDGMDISLLRINISTGQMQWAGANNPLWIYKQATGIVEEIKPDKQPIGIHDNLKPFTNHELKAAKDDILYLFTDGYADQFGGNKGKKLKYSTMQQRIVEYAALGLQEQKKRLEEMFDTWKGNFEQTDDVCVLGIRCEM